MKKEIKRVLLILTSLFILSFLFFKFYWSRESKKIVFSHIREYIAAPNQLEFVNLNFTPSKIREINDSLIILENQNAHNLLLVNLKNKEQQPLYKDTSNIVNKYKLITEIEIKNNNVYVTDSRQKKIVSYRTSGEFIGMDSILFDFSRSIMINEGFFLFQKSIMKDYRPIIDFSAVDVKNGLVKMDSLFKEAIVFKPNSDMIDDGFFARDEDEDKFYYVCYQNNYFFCFNDKMKVLYKKNFIHSTPLPIIKQNGNIRYTESSYIGVVGVTAKNGKLFILSNIGDKKFKKNRIVDIYRGSDGEYLNSYIAPNNIENTVPLDIHKGRAHTYFMYNNGFNYSN